MALLPHFDLLLWSGFRTVTLVGVWWKGYVGMVSSAARLLYAAESVVQDKAFEVLKC